MGQILIKLDSTIKHPAIEIPLVNSSAEEAGDAYRDNKIEDMQTSTYGIQAPLIQIGQIVVDFTDVIEFSLKSSYELPTLTMLVRDRKNLISSINQPGSDNEIVVQILPRFEQAYKKVNMLFYINNIKINNNIINISASYKLPEFTGSRFQSFGMMTPYDIFYQAAKDTGLGFATNLEESGSDKHYMYCDNKSYVDLLNREIRYAGSENQIMTWWVDYWNNINYIDIYERYTSKDPQEEMKVWTATQKKETGEANDIAATEVDAIINNLPSAKTSELYAVDKQVSNKTGSQLFLGTDKVYSVYNEESKEYSDTLVQDGDVQKDIFTKYEYLGECIGGESNYLLNDKLRSAFLQKIDAEAVVVTLNSPLLGLMRGEKVNLEWYILDDKYSSMKKILKEHDVLDEPATENPSTDEPSGNTDTNWDKDKSISGQYLITATNMTFKNGNWRYILTLNRPADQKPKLLKEKE